MIVVYATAPNGAKTRKVFWSDEEAIAYCRDLLKKGYTLKS